jgi:hypothetical protein
MTLTLIACTVLLNLTVWRLHQRLNQLEERINNDYLFRNLHNHWRNN